MTGQNELRAVRPEAVLVINGKEYPVGGLEAQPVHNFDKRFPVRMQLCDSAFVWLVIRLAKQKNAFLGNRTRPGLAIDIRGLCPQTHHLHL